MAKGDPAEQGSTRQLAEEQVSKQPAISQMNNADKDWLLRELQLHHAELKLQHQALREHQGALHEAIEHQAQENLRQLEVSRHIVTVQERERRQLALDLHDIVSPNVAAIKANLYALRSSLPPQALELASGRLRDIESLLDETAAKLRELGTDLRPVVLDYLGLCAALEAYAEQFGARTGVSVDVSGPAGEIEGRRLAPDVESKLFRIAQEALTNCAKHAKAKNVRIALEHDAEHGTMSVSDDGAGFDPKTLDTPEGSPGLGLLTMKERAEFVGGTCRIESEPGRGTRVIVEF